MCVTFNKTIRNGKFYLWIFLTLLCSRVLTFMDLTRRADTVTFTASSFPSLMCVMLRMIVKSVCVCVCEAASLGLFEF